MGGQAVKQGKTRETCVCTHNSLRLAQYHLSTYFPHFPALVPYAMCNRMQLRNGTSLGHTIDKPAQKDATSLQ